MFEPALSWVDDDQCKVQALTSKVNVAWLITNHERGFLSGYLVTRVRPPWTVDFNREAEWLQTPWQALGGLWWWDLHANKEIKLWSTLLKWGLSCDRASHCHVTKGADQYRLRLSGTHTQATGMSSTHSHHNSYAIILIPLYLTN